MAIPVAIIDDDASVCRSLSRLLRLAGFEPRAFASAEAFLDDVDRARFRCLLVDVQLNGMSGLEMQRAWKALPGHAPLIFITAYDEPGARADALRAGCAGFFSKTESGARILDAIRAAVWS
jgi:FixJ family two-component response regulator